MSVSYKACNTKRKGSFWKDKYPCFLFLFYSLVFHTKKEKRSNMKAAVLLLLASIALVSAYTEQEYRSAFTAWMLKHSRTYASSEFQNRYSVFKSNMDYVRDWNAQNTETIRMWFIPLLNYFIHFFSHFIRFTHTSLSLFFSMLIKSQLILWFYECNLTI